MTRLRLLYTAVIFLMPAAGFSAATHVIQFGGTLGLVYSPSSLSVTVGDTIRWEGDFSIHPLSSTTIPVGASSWHNGTGTVFDYVVAVAGTYNYHCDNHFSLGMVGSFDAVLAGVENREISRGPGSFQLGQNYPNPFNPSTTIEYTIPGDSHTSLKVYNLLGQPVATLVERDMPAGVYRARFDASALPSGVYIYRLQARLKPNASGGGAETFVAVRKLVIVK